MLFREDYGYTPLAAELSDEAHHTLRELFRKYVKMGCSPRDIGYIITSQVPLIDMEFRWPYNLPKKDSSNA